MGSDAKTNVAGPTGELHDAKGVWSVGTCTFPSASGANPMVTCMALAHRTADAILAKLGVT